MNTIQHNNNEKKDEINESNQIKFKKLKVNQIN